MDINAAVVMVDLDVDLDMVISINFASFLSVHYHFYGEFCTDSADQCYTKRTKITISVM